MANEKTALQVLEEVGAILDGHFVYTRGLHGKRYVAKEALYPHTVPTSNLCADIAKLFLDDQIDVVVSPAVGGIPLSMWTANHLTTFLNREVLGVFVERDEVSVFKLKHDDHHMNIKLEIENRDSLRGAQLMPGEELFLKRAGFIFKRGYGPLVANKRVLIVEDVINTGDTVREVVKATRLAGGEIIAVGALCNRGNSTAETLDVPRLHSLVEIQLETWSEEGCGRSGPCSEGLPINEMFGKGKDYLALKRAG